MENVRGESGAKLRRLRYALSFRNRQRVGTAGEAPLSGFRDDPSYIGTSIETRDAFVMQYD